MTDRGLKIWERPEIWVSVAVFMLTVLPYLQTARFDFVNYDDDRYAYQNEAVSNGLSVASIRWAFSGESVRATGHWHPLAVLSLIADGGVFGVKAGPMHLHSALLHGLNAVLVFVFLWWVLCPQEGESGGGGLSPRRILPLAALAALFWSLHPLRVESVAWISSRKDVLSLFWFLLGTLAYLRDVRLTRGTEEPRDFSVYLFLSAWAFVLAFLAKPTAIVFPVTALLCEYALTRGIVWRRLQIFGFITFVFVVITCVAQASGGAMASGREYHLLVRGVNACAALAHYVTKTVCPAALSPIYPYRIPVPFWPALAGCGLAVALAAWFCTRIWPVIRSCPPFPAKVSAFFFTGGSGGLSEGDVRGRMYTALGVLWFLVCFAPVSGLARQVGCQAYADRYTYIGGIGFSVILGGFLARVAGPARRGLFAGLCFLVACAVAAYAVGTVRYVAKWQDAETLWTHVLKHAPDNHIAVCNRGAVYFEKGDHGKALALMCQSAVINGGSNYVLRLESILGTMEKLGPYDNILLTEVKPDDSYAAVKYLALGQIAEMRNISGAAERFYREAIRAEDRDFSGWMLLGLLLSKQEVRQEEALTALRQALERRPGDPFLRQCIRQGEKAQARKGK